MPLTLENEQIKVEIDAVHGGRVTGFFAKKSGREYLWYDAARLPVNPALDYDGNFAGGMDELLPCDLPENGWPDHGELWTLPLTSEVSPERVTLSGILPKCGLSYQRKMSLRGNTLVSEYTIANPTAEIKNFLWKMHAALAIAPGDKLFAPAECVQAADPGDWSRAVDGMPHAWRGEYTVPAMDGTSDFFYLTGIDEGKLELRRTDGGIFRCAYDGKAFPCVWIFASFGRLNNSRTLIMEPCTNYPISISDAQKAKVCAKLLPGAAMQTVIEWSAE